MYPFQRILLATDFSLCAERAFEHALFLAERYRAEVYLLHVADGDVPTHYRLDGPEAQIAMWPQRVTARPAQWPPLVEHRNGLSLHRDVVYHMDPVVAILDYAAAHSVDLIVMGAHGDRGAGHFLSVGSAFLGRTAEQVVRHAVCPVYRIVMRNGDGPEHVRRLLVPVDGSALSLLALSFAKDLAAHYNDAHIEVLQVLETRVVHTDPADGPGETTEDRLERARAALIEHYEQAPGAMAAADFHIVQGRPDREIRTFAKRHNVDLVVLGAHSDLGRDVLGDVAEQVIRTARAPVLTVRKTATERGHTAAPFPLSSALKGAAEGHRKLRANQEPP